MVQTILPWLAHIETRTQRHSCTHTHIHTVTIIKIDKACNLLHSGLNRDLCVRHLSLSRSLSEPVMCLFITPFVSHNPSHAYSLCYFILLAHSHRNTLMLPSLPNKNPPPTDTRAHTHTSSVLDTVDYNQTECYVRTGKREIIKNKQIIIWSNTEYVK